MSKNRDKVSKETAKVVATMMVPMVGLACYVYQLAFT